MPPLRGVTFYSHVWRRTFLAVTKGTRKEGWSPGVATRAGMVGFMADCDAELPERSGRLAFWTWSFVRKRHSM
jgi:hypothetical protein